MLSKRHFSYKVYFALFLAGKHNLGVLVNLFPSDKGGLCKMIVDINDLLYEEALKYSSQDAQQADFVKEVFTFYIRAHANQSLAKVGGKAPNMKDINRR